MRVLSRAGAPFYLTLREIAHVVLVVGGVAAVATHATWGVFPLSVVVCYIMYTGHIRDLGPTNVLLCAFVLLTIYLLLERSALPTWLKWLLVVGDIALGVSWVGLHFRQHKPHHTPYGP